jgi:hypothetical protein
MGRGYASLWAEDAPLCGRIKIRCYDMGEATPLGGGRIRFFVDGLKSVVMIWGEAMPLCERILIRCYDMGEAAPLC